MTTMRASVLTGPQTIELRSGRCPAPGPDEVLVRVGVGRGVRVGRALLQARPDRVAWSSTGPLVLGHEVGGTIVAVGDAVRPRPRRPARGARAAAALPPLPAVQDRAPEPLPAHGVLRDPADRRRVLRLRHAPGRLRAPGAGLALRRRRRPARAAVGRDLGQPEGRYDGRQPASSSPAPDRSARWRALAARAMGATEIIVSDPVESRRQRITELASAPSTVDPTAGFDPADDRGRRVPRVLRGDPGAARRADGRPAGRHRRDGRPRRREITLPVQDIAGARGDADRHLPLRRHLAGRDLARGRPAGSTSTRWSPRASASTRWRRRSPATTTR